MANAHLESAYSRPRRHLEEAVHVALEELGYDERRDEDGNILAVAGIRWDSWGEEIQIQIDGDDAGTRVRYESVAGNQLFDWGKSRRNVLDLSNEVERRLAA